VNVLSIRSRGFMLTGALATVAACASAPTAKPVPYQVGASVGTPPSLPPARPAPVTQQGNDASVPPTMTSGQPSIVGTPSARVSISANNEDVASVVDRMARQVGLTAIIDPAVRGPVTRSLQNVSINDAMASLLGSQYRYQVRNGALIVGPATLVHHTYTVDYLTLSRISTGSTVVSRGTQGATATSNSNLIAGVNGTGTGVSSTGAGLVASGADVIQSSSQADVWGELTQQLESIIFGGASDSARAGAAAAANSYGTGARAYSRCDTQSRVCLRISPVASLVDVTASQETQDEVTRWLALFNAAVSRQVLIKAQVVEVRLDRSRSYGIDWQSVLSTARGTIFAATRNGLFPTDPTKDISSTSNMSFNIGVGDLTLRAVINALESVGDVSVVANPQTLAMNNQKASFNVTRQQQFVTITRTQLTNAQGNPTGTFSETPSIQTATVGLVFDVLPQISDKNIVQMAIRPSMTSLVSVTTVTGSNGELGQLPVTDHRETDTMARVRSGETIVIGGLIQKQNETVRSGIPVLKDLPIFGRLFSTTKVEEHNSELVIFVTPEIVSGQPPGGG